MLARIWGKKEHSYNIGENVGEPQYGKQCGSSLKNQK
jgi:hypothetical protein